MCNGEEGSFRVLVENEACGIVGHHCAKAVTIFFQGGLIVMQDREVTRTNSHTPVPTDRYMKSTVFTCMLNMVFHLIEGLTAWCHLQDIWI